MRNDFGDCFVVWVAWEFAFVDLFFLFFEFVCYMV